MRSVRCYIISTLFIASGCITSYYCTPEMKMKCDGFKYSPQKISEISKVYPDSNYQSVFHLTIYDDSTYFETLESCIGDPSKIYGKCSIVQDTLKLFPLRRSAENGQIRDIVASERMIYCLREHYYLIRKINTTIYLIEPGQLDQFCTAIIDQKNKDDFFHKVIGK